MGLFAWTDLPRSRDRAGARQAAIDRAMLKAGIVGLPNVGKSTLFNVLTQAQNAEVANYPFCTIEPNQASSPCQIPGWR